MLVLKNRLPEKRIPEPAVMINGGVDELIRTYTSGNCNLMRIAVQLTNQMLHSNAKRKNQQKNNHGAEALIYPGHAFS